MMITIRFEVKAQRDQLLASRRRVDAKAQKSHEVARSRCSSFLSIFLRFSWTSHRFSWMLSAFGAGKGVGFSGRTLVADGKKKEAVAPRTLRSLGAEMLALRRWEQQKRLGEDCQNHLNKLEDTFSSRFHAIQLRHLLFSFEFSFEGAHHEH